MGVAIGAILGLLTASFSVAIYYVRIQREALKNACNVVTRAKNTDELDRIKRDYKPVVSTLSLLGQHDAVNQFTMTLEIKQMSFNKPVFKDEFFS